MDAFNNNHTNVLFAYQNAVTCCETLEEKLRTTSPEKPLIRQYLENCEAAINLVTQMERPGSLYTMALTQVGQKITKLIANTEEKDTKPNIEIIKQKPDAKKYEKYYRAIDETRVTNPLPSLSDIGGHTEVKKQLKTMLILPRKQPQLFINKPVHNSVLLYGPPGTGKTKLAYALAGEADADIYCITASSIMSKYSGETEKMIQMLFKYVKTVTKTSIIFIDEIDGLCRKRRGDEHDSSRRIKTEIMCQLSNFSENINAFLICATNCPWDLDTAFLRRFQTRIYVPMPTVLERLELLKLYTRTTPLSETHRFWECIIDQTDGYSGSDLQELVRNALMRPIAELEDIKIWKLAEDNTYIPVNKLEYHEFSENLRFCRLDELPEGSVRARQVALTDLLEAAKATARTVPPSEIEIFNHYK